MGLSFDCPKCSGRLEVQQVDAGKTDKCPLCGEEIEIPNATQPRAIGGWLLVIALGFPLGAIKLGISIISALNQRESLYPLSEGPSPGMLLSLDIVGLAVLITVAVLFYSQRRIAIPAMIGLLIANVVYGFVLAGLLHDAMWVARALVPAAVWIPYFLLSKRVKYTFTQ